MVPLIVTLPSMDSMPNSSTEYKLWEIGEGEGVVIEDWEDLLLANMSDCNVSE